MNIFPKLNIGDLQISKPIIQGGMSVGVSLSGLAAAVANQGGVGVIGTAGIGFQDKGFAEHPIEMNLEALTREIRRAKEMSDGIIGVNIMRALTDFNELVQTSILEKVDIIFIGAGLPLALPKGPAMDNLKTMRTKIVPIVSSPKAVKVIFKYWERHYDRLPDAIVVEGPKAGGHLGFKKPDLLNTDIDLKNILTDVIDEIKSFGERLQEKIPVIAAGGIFDREDMLDMFKTGAKGVQLGTRFVTTEECDASEKFKEQYIKAKESDIALIDSPVGMPG
ncbi:MAG: nitronate monooxygenase, partial [candidate division WOR-3 bacterium]|nr:nitronate monooxygenase [candidate division WOR-3 bacterium]